MKRFVLALTAVIISAGVMAQAPQAAQKKADDYVKFKQLKYDFGKIKQGVPVTYDFGFSNVTDKPVVIESATASCGCTTPKWPQAPVAKGKSDKITAGFNAQAVGPFNKSIYVKLAGVAAPLEIRITGEVLTADDYTKYEKEKDNKKS